MAIQDKLYLHYIFKREIIPRRFLNTFSKRNQVNWPTEKLAEMLNITIIIVRTFSLYFYVKKN